MFIPPDQRKIDYFRRGIKKWRIKNGLRDYPWRVTKDPFKLFVTEILLRRTRSDTVSDNWYLIFSRINSFKDLREMDKEKLENILKPLGLFRLRTDNLIQIASIIKDNIPKNEKKLITLPGVGKYITRMYLLMRYNTRGLIYDTNFRRVYMRFFGINIITDLKRDKIIEPLSDLVIPRKNIKIFILSILDFSALVCKPQNPDCASCTLNKKCTFFMRKYTELS